LTIPVRFADEGIELAGGLVWLDAQKPKPIGIISHAHGDHVGRHATIICTRDTATFVRQRNGHQANYVVLAYGETHHVGDLEITLHAAGHILGAAVVHIKGPHGTLVYSGDVKLAAGRTTPAAVPVQAQTLIMEATFGTPAHRLPPPEESREQLIAFARQEIEAGRTPVFLAYALGKGQEVLALLTQAGIPVAAHGSIWNLLGPYRAAGLAFPGARRLSRNGARKAAIVTPPRYLTSGPVQASGKITVASVTGWGNRTVRPGIDLSIPLSDHADYDELIELVERVQPEQVHVLHGYAQEFAADLRERGFQADAVEGHSGPEEGTVPGMFA
jgi:Cft2 family RNA processing exonuclease